jgi:outer membrane protein assembly factor BamB
MPRTGLPALFLFAALAAPAPAHAADWPAWRADAARSAITAETLPAGLRLLWTLQLPPLEPAWPGEPRSAFDDAYQPIAAGGMLFIASSRNDSVTAYDLATAGEKWRFHADGPVRFAPAAWKAPDGAWRLFVASDDGWLYCLDAASGSPRWKFRGGPDGRLVLGNGRLVSLWTARGGPLVADGVVYFAAGIWPFMGVFVHALDAASGKELWCNDDSGAVYTVQPHKSPAFGGIAPQGYLAVAGGVLVVPNGRAVPAGIDRADGKLLHFRHGDTQKQGHSRVIAFGPNAYLSSGKAFDARTGTVKADISWQGVAEWPAVYQAVRTPLNKPAIAAVEPGQPTAAVYHGAGGSEVKTKRNRHFWEADVAGQPLLRAGRQLLAADGNTVVALNVPDRAAIIAAAASPPAAGKPAVDRPLPPPAVAWRLDVGAAPVAALVADGRLVVVSAAGAVRCYGEEAATGGPRSVVAVHPDNGRDDARPPNTLAADCLAAAGAADGYCLLLGLTDGGLAEQIARSTRMHVIAIDPSAAVIDALRRRADAAGLYGVRISAIAADPCSVALPKYLASLIVSERPAAVAPAAERLYESLRPYGGAMCLALGEADADSFVARLRKADLPNAELTQPRRAAAPGSGKATANTGATADAASLCILRRAGALPGAGTWTGQYGDAGNTLVSPDDRVRLPLGLLWFAAPDSASLLPRHGHGPPEQVLGGRLFIEGPDLLRAVDVYTGRRLWQRELPGVGRFYNSTAHVPGANVLGTNFLATPQGVYVVRGDRCLLLDAATGGTVRELTMRSAGGNSGALLGWSYISACDTALIAGLSPMEFETPEVEHSELIRVWWDAEAGKHVSDGPSKAVETLAPAVRRWTNFQRIEDAAPLELPSPAVEDDTPGMPEHFRASVKDAYFVAANFNKMLRHRDVAAKLPPAVLASARNASMVARAKSEDWNRKLLDTAEKLAQTPPELAQLPRTAAMIEQEIRDRVAASGVPDGQADPVLAMLNRELLEWCYGELPRKPRPRPGQWTHSLTASREIAVLDRLDGKPLWRRQAQHAFKHNAIAAGGGIVFAVDRLPEPVVQRLLFRGEKLPPATLLAIDLRTGSVLWQTRQDVFGTWLGYSSERDVLLQAARPSRDMLREETGGRLVAYRGRTGQVLWDRPVDYGGPCILHGLTIITQGTVKRTTAADPPPRPSTTSAPAVYPPTQAGALDLLTGQPVTRPHPLTGEAIGWTFARNYGCGTAIASRHLLTFRSAAAGFFDLDNLSGTGNWGGFRSGCTSNLIAADGVLNAPDYTYTCRCSYQIQASLALVHMPGEDNWTFQNFDRGKGPIRRLGINLGAPGDRMADNGTLWLEWPGEGGPSPRLLVTVKGADANGPTYFRRHTSAVAWHGRPARVSREHLAPAVPADAKTSTGATPGTTTAETDAPPPDAGLPWVAASGAEGIAELTVPLGSASVAPSLGDAAVPAGTYTISLHFAEPGAAAAGERVFSVAIEGKVVLKDFDIAAAAGGPLRPVVRTLKGLKVDDLLEITLTAAPGCKIPRPVLCGVEVVKED